MKKAILTIAIIFSVIATTFLIIWLSKSELEKHIILNNDSYNEKWHFDYIDIDDENQTISIKFEHQKGYWNDSIDSIHDTYELVCNKFFEDDSLKDYSVNLNFVGIGELFLLHNITAELNQIEVPSNTPVELKNIASYFPEAAKLNLSPTLYDDISEFKDFNNLKYISLSYTLSEDEISVLKSYFPDCEISYLGDDGYFITS